MNTPLILTLALLAIAAILVIYVRFMIFKRKAPRADDVRKRVSRVPQAQQASRRVLSAARTIEVSRSLRKSNAQWSEILSSLNPGDDSRVKAALFALRGPHMFVPHTALNIIEHECSEMLRLNPAATQLAGLVRAKESMEKVTRFGE